jgi:hypothetical protein
MASLQHEWGPLKVPTDLPAKFGTIQAKSSNPIRLAQACGDISGGFAARQIYTAMEVMFILGATRQMKFVNGPAMRLRQNVFIEGPPGIGKSFAADTFYEKCCGAIDIMARSALQSKAKTSRPVLIQQSGGMTFEKMRGSCTTDGRPIMPALIDGNFVNLTEMNAVFGEPPRIDMKQIRLFGMLTEEGKMTVSLLKMDEWSVEEAEAFADLMRDNPNYIFSVSPRGYTFYTQASFSVCTTELDPETRRILRQCGFLSRFDHVKTEMTLGEQLEFLDSFGGARKPPFEAMQAINQDIWNSRFCPIPYPPDELLHGYVQKWIVEQAKEISSGGGQPLHAVNLRDIGNAARLMAAHAIARIFEARQRGDRSRVDAIHYTKDDADFAIWYLQPHFNNLKMNGAVAGDASEGGEWDGTSNIEQKALVAYLKHVFDGEVLPHNIKLQDFVKFASKGGVPTEKTVKNYISKLSKARILTRGRYGSGTATVDEQFMLRVAGLQPMQGDAYEVYA